MDSREIVVVLPNKKEIIVNNVPEDILAGGFLSRIEGIDEVQSLKFPLKVSDQGYILESNDIIPSDKIDIVEFKPKENSFKVIVYITLLIASLMIPLYMYFQKKAFIWCVSSMLLIYALYISIALLIRPPEHVDLSSNTVLDVIVLFFKSLLPTFRLEQVLIREE